MHSSSGDVGDTLFYHYTSADSAIKILQNRELWLTRSDCFDDTLELSRIEPIVRKVLEACSPEQNRILYPFAEYCAKTSKEPKSHLLDSPSILKFNKNRGYILCLSADANNGYLWKNYCGNGEIKVALEIDTRALGNTLEGFPDCGISCKAQKVLYEGHNADGEIARLIRNELERYFGANFVTPNSELEERLIEKLNSDLSYIMDALRPFVKSSEFESENEYRFLISAPEQEDFFAESSNKTVHLKAFTFGEKKRLAISMSDSCFFQVVRGGILRTPCHSKKLSHEELIQALQNQ